MHCANSGSMLGLDAAGTPVLLSRSDSPRRKLPYTLELVSVGGVWVGVNTQAPNRLVGEALRARQVPGLADYDEVKAEVRWGERCRFDFRLQNTRQTCFVEVKGVTLARGELALFPDAVTVRGTRHLQELIKVVQSGHRAVMFFLVHREDCSRFAPARDIDPVYAETLEQAQASGVEILVYRSIIRPPEILLGQKLPFSLY